MGSTNTDLGMGMTLRHKQFLKNFNMTLRVEHRFNMDTTPLEVFVLPRLQ